MNLLSKYDGRCKTCGGRYLIGDDVAWDPQTRKASHPGCAPLALSRAPIAAATPQARQETAQEAALAALAALEHAVIVRASETGAADLERAWDRLQKCKALALRPGTQMEGRAALRVALVEAVKLVF